LLRISRWLYISLFLVVYEKGKDEGGGEMEGEMEKEEEEERRVFIAG